MKNEIKPLPNGDFEVVPMDEYSGLPSTSAYETVPLDDPDFLEAQKKREDAMQALSEFGEEMEKHRIADEARIDQWWNNLSYEEQTDAFYAVVKRLVHGELEKRGTYRYVLYDVFGFGPDMYIRGMDCGYMALHNSIVDEE
jgi:hypothetical protein